MLPKLLFISLLSSFIFTHSYTQCLHHQKSLLLQLKNELIFNSSLSTKLVQWNQSDDCCKWYGVECDAAGNVINLQLDHEAISGGTGNSSSLFRLTYLQKLNLAYNDFNAIPIPKGIHNLTYFTHLNLSNAGFGGQVPAEISSLRRLVSLDITCFNTISVSLEMLAQNLTGLRELYLDGVEMSANERRKWSHIISSYLPNITTLSLRDCSLSGPLARSFSQLRSLSTLQLDGNDLSAVDFNLFANFPSLTTLSLVDCDLNGHFPNMILQIPTLQYLDLTYNFQLSGSLPPFTKIGSLKSLRLMDTNFSGSIPSSISNLKSLSEIDLSRCQFTGSIPSTFANLTELVHVGLSGNLFTGSLSSTLFEGFSNLGYVDLSYNSLTGSLSSTFFEGLSNLGHVDLSYNLFTGSLSSTFFEGLSNLGYVDLSYNLLTGSLSSTFFEGLSNLGYLSLMSNQLKGPIPNSLFQLHNLESVYLSDNLFNGTFQLDKIQNLANLTHLDLSRNNLSVHVSNDNSRTYGLPKLQGLRLASCNMYDFPNFIKHSDMGLLDLSNNQIVGEIPSWIWGRQLWSLNLSLNLLTGLQKPCHIPAFLKILDLQSNQLKGELHPLIPPNITPDLKYLLLANNSFSGSIPTSFCTARNLELLDLSVNNLSGSIPSCLLNDTMILRVLNLEQNNISGQIPDNFSLNCVLEHFDVNNNTLEGKIPKSLERCNQLEFMNVGNNIINDIFPCMMLSSSLRVLVLHSNRFHGEVRCRQRWPELQIIDISSNNFSGSLQSINFSSWRGMVIGGDAQFGHNKLSYNNVSIIQKLAVKITMKGLEVELVKIYPDFTAIDFSCNNFQGKIPNAIGDLSSLRLLNLSHNALNGSISKSFGKLGELESLDLSRNQLAGAIPLELAKLTFLSFLNLSYNKLVGEIPNDRHLQTFSADSFKGNPGLCGFNLNISCSHSDSDDDDDDDDDVSPLEHENVEEKKEIEWEYVSSALGYVVGLGSIVWLLIFCQSFRYKYFDKIEEVVEEIFDGRNRRRRHARRSAVRNRLRRQ